MKHYKRLTKDNRLQIEILYNQGYNANRIAKIIGFHHSAIYREIKRGLYDHLNGQTWLTSKRYSADKAHTKSVFLRSSQGRLPKIGNDHQFVKYCKEQIKKNMSPYAILKTIEKNNLYFKTTVCLSTLYNYIRKGMFYGISASDMIRPRKTKHRQHKERKGVLKGFSIEQRCQEANNRLFGHWELDSVLGKRAKGQTLLCFTERSTRFELIFRAEAKTKVETIKTIEFLKMHLQSDFPKIFKTITTDNGTEFALDGYFEKQYFCHPYSSWERGSNENQNGFIRRFIPKGERIENYTDEYLQQVQNYINDYPRRLFGGKSAREMMEEALQNQGIFTFPKIF